MRRHTYNILNHSKWRRIEKELSKCSVIGRRLMMGQFTLGSYGVMKSWMILILFERMFLKIIFLHGKIFEFSNFFGCLKILFNANGKGTVWWFGVFFFLFLFCFLPLCLLWLYVMQHVNMCLSFVMFVDL